MTKKIYLVDGNSFIYRMFFALPEFSTKDGKIVNAIFGMAKFFVGQLTKENPDYLVFIVDAKGKNFRHKIFEDYKATRDKMPDNLKDQIENILDMIKTMGIKIVEIPGYEADDIIGTLATKLTSPQPSPQGEGVVVNKKEKIEIDILTGDKDLYSLVSENVKIYDTMKGKKFGISETEKKFGVKPEKIIDYLAIVGDKADNIPGIEGFGPKKAVDLINIIGGIEEIYNFIDKEILPLLKEKNSKKIEKEIKELLIEKFGEESAKKINSIFKGKTFEKLLNSRDNAFLSKKLATIKKDVELKNFDLEDYKFEKEKILNEKTKEIFRKFEFNSLLPEETKKMKKWEDLGLKVKIIDSDKKLEELLEKNIKKYEKIILDTETTSLEVEKAELVGISIYLDDKNIYYINRLHNGEKVSDKKLLDFIEKIFKMDKLIIGHNLKYDLEILELFKINSNNSKNNPPLTPPSNQGGGKEKQISLNF